jgi:hypothetical protein
VKQFKGTFGVDIHVTLSGDIYNSSASNTLPNTHSLIGLNQCGFYVLKMEPT